MREEREERESIEGMGSIFLLLLVFFSFNLMVCGFLRTEEKGRSASFSFIPVFSRRFSFKKLSRGRHAHFFSLEVRKGEKVHTAFIEEAACL